MWVRAALAGLLLAVAAPARAHMPETGTVRLCFDVAIVARIVKATPTEYPDLRPDEIVTHWPWHVDLDVEQVLIGTEAHQRIRALASLHSGFNPAIEHLLVLLVRGKAGYGVAGFHHLVARDASGRFVVPLAAPLPEDYLYPEGWVPRVYADVLRPVTYDAQDAWWLHPPYMEAEDLRGLDPSWARRSGNGAVALRGLFLEDWARKIRTEAGALCPPL